MLSAVAQIVTMPLDPITNASKVHPESKGELENFSKTKIVKLHTEIWKFEPIITKNLALVSKKISQELDTTIVTGGGLK